MRLICTYEPLCAREGPFASVRSSVSAPMQRAAEARAGMDRDESTVIDRDIAIYQTVNADADSDGPGPDRDRAQSPYLLWFPRLASEQDARRTFLRRASGAVCRLLRGAKLAARAMAPSTELLVRPWISLIHQRTAGCATAPSSAHRSTCCLPACCLPAEPVTTSGEPVTISGIEADRGPVGAGK